MRVFSEPAPLGWSAFFKGRRGLHTWTQRRVGRFYENSTKGRALPGDLAYSADSLKLTHRSPGARKLQSKLIVRYLRLVRSRLVLDIPGRARPPHIAAVVPSWAVLC